jgi:ribosomal protein S14
MTGAPGAVAKATDEPGDGVHAVPALDPEESEDVDVEADTEGCERCGEAPREELVEISIRDVIVIVEVCRPCAREVAQFSEGNA